MPRAARADDVDDFAFALRAYVSDEFEVAATRFQALLSQGSLRTPSLVEASRRYLAATFLFLNREADARAVLRELLRVNPAAQVDPIQFSPAVVSLLRSVREQLREAGTLQEFEQAIARARAAETARREGARRVLLALTTHESLVMQVPRWQVMLPLGIAQFANGQDGVGWFFLVSETLELAAALASWSLGASLFPDPGLFGTYPASRVGELDALRGVEVAGWGLLAVTAVAGIVQGNVAYRGERREVRTRPAPPELTEITQQLSLGGAPAGATLGLSLRLRF